MKHSIVIMSLLRSREPDRALRALYKSGWLKINIPELHRLYGVPQNADHHPEVDCGLHIELCLRQCVELGASAEVRLAVLLHDLGKGITPEHILPGHHDHENTGIPLVEEVCNRLDVPAYWKKLALAVCENHLLAHKSFVLRSSRIERFVRELGLDKDKKFLADFVLACRCDATGRAGKDKAQYRQANFIIGVTNELKKLPAPLEFPVFTGEDHKLHVARLDAIRFMRDVHNVKGMKEGDSYI